MNQIVPYPGDPNYGVTRDGQVYRIVRSHDHGRHVPFLLSQRFDKDGYVMVGGGASTMKVHRLVAETFIPNPHGYEDVAHNDGVRHHNTVGNLRWDNDTGNHADKKLHGTQFFGETHPLAQLTDALVRQARQRARRGESHTRIADDMPVCRSVLSRAIRGETWAHV